ncbi:unnamed protein product [Orchesella dallaii]|uniref:Protein sleepless n=1 Tax=Orchesella dallaii TaxID=48710 RepID=A0ABP1RHQ3_9HEXA
MFKFTVLSTVLLLVFASSSEALKCYSCSHQSFESDSSDTGDIACKDGPLDSSFSEDCGSLKYVEVAENVFVPTDSYLGRNVKNATVISPDEQRQYGELGCIKLAIAGVQPLTSVRSEYIYRDCLLLFEVNNKCYANKNSKIGDDIDDSLLKAYVALSGVVFSDDSDVDVCSCNGDLCNGAVTTFTASALLLIATTLLLQFVK